MYTIEDLFDKRSVVGAKIGQIIEHESYTKSRICKETGVSRPTLDKILLGTHTNKTTYVKHISKILQYLMVTPDILMGNIKNENVKIRAIRNLMKVSSEAISKVTGIPLHRLGEIESGDKATIAELRDIALCLSTSVRGVEGSNFFDVDIAELSYWRDDNSEPSDCSVSGFWGHVGVLVAGKNEFCWYPITAKTYIQVRRSIDNEKLVIPCMNNKLLFLNMENIDEIVLLDEACDQPGYINWDYEVDCGELPLVIYDALEDYIYYDDFQEDGEVSLSNKFIQILDKLIEKKKWTDDEIETMLCCTKAYFKNGRCRELNIDFDRADDLTSMVATVYAYDEYIDDWSRLFVEDIGGTEIIINMKNLSFMEMPMTKIENSICENLKEIF